VPQYNAPRGDRAGYRGGGRERGGFGRGRGPVVCHNCQQPGHYARECPLPPATCMYCHASDHDTEECLTLLGKIQEKRNQNNQNVQWISAEVRDEGRNINIVTWGGAKTGNDAVRQEPTQHQWVKKNVEPKKQFDAQNEKEIFKQARQEFMKPDIASTSTAQHNKEVPEYEMPPSLDHTKETQPLGQVSMIKGFFAIMC
jgi:hypothetical protein